MVRGLILAVIALVPCAAVGAATLDGVAMPEIRVTDGTRMRLNGMGLRTYSIFGLHIYVAGLYLEQRSNDSASILRSPERKLLDIRFLRDVDAVDARKAWQDGFANNCRPPECYL
ncbi:MAG TPA: chalcone isomerase family protein, partial [Rhodopila sp.]|nr:chalcone isomerase family protein [Rhodopila sp.]